MEQKDTIVTLKRLATDEGFYTSVFKKTEKITSVISYIVSHINANQKDSVHTERVLEKALKTQDYAIAALQLSFEEAPSGLLSLQYELMSLDSTLRVAQAAGVLSESVLQLLIEQIDSVQRYINNHFTKEEGYSIDISTTRIPAQTGSAKPPKTANKSTAAPARRQRVQIPAGDISTDAYLVYSQMTDRAERIKTVLEAKPKATIKDVAEVITDVSEKTIQRELNSLIEKGQVIREGERRWSTYSIKK